MREAHLRERERERSATVRERETRGETSLVGCLSSCRERERKRSAERQREVRSLRKGARERGSIKSRRGK